METGRFGLTGGGDNLQELGRDTLKEKLIIPDAERVFSIQRALHAGMSLDEIQQLTRIDPWFLSQLKEIYDLEVEIRGFSAQDSGFRIQDSALSAQHSGFNKNGDFLPAELLLKAKQYGFSDRQIAGLINSDEFSVRRLRKEQGILPTYKMVDTCAAEFEAVTPYYYSTYESEDEVKHSDSKKVMVLGSGPNRIGQGIEFDYACVHAAFALREEGFETIMVNSNPETVSTDYDTSDRLYFEPLTVEDVLNIYEKENPLGVIVQFGGQTPLNLARDLERNGVKILGTSPESIDIAEDRERFKVILDKLSIPQPENGIARSFEDALVIAGKIGYPLMVRPSYVLGGRAMEIVYDENTLRSYVRNAVKVSPQHPVYRDRCRCHIRWGDSLDWRDHGAYRRSRSAFRR